MQKSDRTLPLVREQLDLPATWENLRKIHIPLGYATQKALIEIGAMLLSFLVAAIPILIILSLTFREFMHVIKPITVVTALRSIMYIALVVSGIWIFSRAILPQSLDRLRLLLRSILPLAFGLSLTLAGG